MSHERIRLLLIAVVLAGSAGAAWVIPGALPPAFGVPPTMERWVGRAFTALFLPFVALVLCLLFRRLSASDPLKENYRRFEGTYRLVLDAAVIFVLGLHLTLLATLIVGVRASIGMVPPLLAGILLVVVGNALPRVRPNAVVGIPTPWARRSPEAWACIHRLAGYVVVSFGLVIIGGTLLLPSGLGWLVGLGTAATVLLLTAASWFVARREGSTCTAGQSEGSSSGPSS